MSLNDQTPIATPKQPPADLADWIERFQKLYTGAINDILDEMDCCDRVLPHGIKALQPGMRVAGVAMPMWGEPTTSRDSDELLIPWMRMLQAVRPGCVIVSQPHDNENAHFGELSSHAAKIQGCQGAVIDGGCRDIEYILAQSRLPVFCRYTTPKDIKGRWIIREYDVPITIGKTVIEPGDFVVGDMDGVIVIPKQITLEVLERAERVKNEENLTRTMILSGEPPLEAYLKYRRF